MIWCEDVSFPVHFSSVLSTFQCLMLENVHFSSEDHCSTARQEILDAVGAEVGAL